jgi:hypothetical protein
MKALALLLLFSAGSVFAQQPAADSAADNAQEKAVFGKVAGRVFCHDTGEPARFASVQLMPEKLEKEPAIDPAAVKGADLSKLMSTAFSAMLKGSNLSTVTALDGTFSLEKVPPGTYYLIPQMVGYVSPLSGYSQKERLKPDDATITAVEGAAQKVVVSAEQIATVTVELERGAALSGKITYDDGSPAPGVTAILLVQQKDGKWKEIGSGGVLPAATDDLGRFRFSGMPAGKYGVKATLPVSQAVMGMGPGSFSMHTSMSDALVVYSGGAMREKDLKAIELTAGEQRDGVEVIFPVNGLHSISGSVVAKSDQHAVNSGMVELKDPDTKAQLRMSTIAQDGTFRFNYIPDGTYVLAVTAADTKAGGKDRVGEGLGTLISAGGGADLTRMLNGKVVKEYGELEQTLIVKSDSTGLTLQVPDKASDAAAKEKGDDSQ